MNEKKIIMIVAVIVVVVVGVILIKELVSSEKQPVIVDAVTEKVEQGGPRQEPRVVQEPVLPKVAAANDTPNPRKSPAPVAKQVVEANAPEISNISGEANERIISRSNQLLAVVRDHFTRAKTDPAYYETVVTFARKIFQEYPDGPQAEEARKLLRDVPVEYLDKYEVTDEELGLTQEKQQ